MSPFKTFFRQTFHKLAKKDRTYFPTIISRLRNHAAIAIISAWTAASSISNRIKAACKTGIYPLNLEVVLRSRFIFNLTDEQRARQEKRDQRRMASLDINCKILTQADMIIKIKAKVSQQKRYEHLCIILNLKNKHILNARMERVCLAVHLQNCGDLISMNQKVFQFSSKNSVEYYYSFSLMFCRLLIF